MGASWRRTATRLLAVTSLGLGLLVAIGPAAPSQAATSQNVATVRRPSHSDVSPALRDINPKAFGQGRIVRREHEPPDTESTGADPVVQQTPSGAATPTPGVGFDGLGVGFSANGNTFNVQYAPPDTDGDVGPNHYVQIVNVGFAVFNKAGTVLYGPAPTNTLFAGFSGGCENNNDGDATVKYDPLADRWIVSQFSISTTPYLQCIAVSTTADPIGPYYRYSYVMSPFPDYPKLGVWSDGYYTTFNMFNGNVFAGSQVCAYDRATMLTGAIAPTQQCLSTSAPSLLPADVDGLTPPPSGSPNYIVDYGSNSLRMWRFHVDWVNSANTTMLGSTPVNGVAPFTAACSGGCVPQYGTSQKLDSLSDRLMYRLAYRNIAGTEHLVVSHAVATSNSGSGVRWYDIAPGGGSSPSVIQQGSFSPDATYRWMSSAAMDQTGGIAVGYSASSSSINPGIRYAARGPSDPTGTLGLEQVLINGTGSQTRTLARWGDYSSMSVDPSDDCTFWYTNEYLKTNGTWNWSTRIGSFKLPSCGSTSPDYSVSVTPSSQSVGAGSPATYAVTVTAAGGYTGTVGLSVTGLPADESGTFSPASLTFAGDGAQPSTLTIATSSGTSSGTSLFTVTATDNNTLTRTAAASLTVNPPASTAVPGAPTNLVAAAAKGKGVQLSWTAPAPNGGSAITGYNVYRGTASGGETLFATLGNVTGLKDMSTARNVRYYYTVAAVNGAGESLPSNEAFATA